ncbi:phosphoglucosamine mutase [Candidatus Moduliflexus flocculans]|uniref:Phosphoglucosamine mutase n=1 Tax=Candidatus Moduliflexus flocculans TaxID=1499966 RepID=A0A0S6W0Y7_9BACT|nr:phosphoglucosamine mutase [Candidatus Moduliflexus flocculans]
MIRLFGTDGIRGVANIFPMTPEMMVKIGMALGAIIADHQTHVIIGRDTRRSGQMLEYALSSGLTAVGASVLLTGILPTPAVAFLTRKWQAHAGIVISASHNPAQDNGVKIFSSTGFKLPDDLETRIEQIVLDEQTTHARPTGADIGIIKPVMEAAEEYAEHIIQSVFAEMKPDFSKMKIVVDCANGAASFLAPSILKYLQANVIEMAVEPDGLNINQQCGALHTKQLCERVLQEQAQIGIAFDGDADRLILVDEYGRQVDGDHILAMLALDLRQKGRLQRNTLVATVMSNLGLEVAMKDAGIQFVRVAVGDRHVVEKMREIGANIGGEQSGHIILFEHGTTGDGIASALTVLKLLQERGKPLSELATCMTTFPQTLINVPVKTRKPIEEMVRVSEAIRQAEKELGDRGRTLVRYSGTELLARVMVEAENEATVNRIAEMIVSELQKENT